MTSIEVPNNNHKRLSKEEAELIGQILSNQGFITHLEMCDLHNNYYNVVVHGIER